MHAAGQMVQALDDARQAFVFVLCGPCRFRFDRLPRKARQRQHRIAIGRIGAAPEKYPFKVFENEIQARLFVALAAERSAADALSLFY